MTPRHKLVGIIIASAVLSCAAAVTAMFFATNRYEQATRESQIERVGYILNRYVNETVWQLFAHEVGNLARDIADETAIRKAANAGDSDPLQQLLPEVWRRNAVTSGQIPLLGVTVYRTDGLVLAEHVITGALHPTPALSEALAKRQGNDRLARLRYVWTDDGAPRLSIVVPIGGLKLMGYLAAHVDPLHALRNLDDRLGMRVVFENRRRRKEARRTEKLQDRRRLGRVERQCHREISRRQAGLSGQRHVG